MSNITILSTEIRQHGELFSLNDLHKASGRDKKHQPANFIRLDQTRELIEEMQSSEMRSAIKVINGGQNRGTYACRELVIAYAAWISAAFHLKVIRVFLNAQTESLPAINVRELLIPDEKKPTASITAETTEMIEKKAFEMAAQALPLCRQYLRNRLTAMECGPADDRWIDRDDAWGFIQSATLDNALAHVFIRKLEDVKCLIGMFQRFGKRAEQELDDMCREKGIRLN